MPENGPRFRRFAANLGLSPPFGNTTLLSFRLTSANICNFRAKYNIFPGSFADYLRESAGKKKTPFEGRRRARPGGWRPAEKDSFRGFFGNLLIAVICLLT